MYRKSVFILILFFSCLYVLGQTAQDITKNNMVQLTSPASEGLLNVGKTAVELFTGTPSITVPLHEINGILLTNPVIATWFVHYNFAGAVGVGFPLACY